MISAIGGKDLNYQNFFLKFQVGTITTVILVVSSFVTLIKLRMFFLYFAKLILFQKFYVCMRENSFG